MERLPPRVASYKITPESNVFSCANVHNKPSSLQRFQPRAGNPPLADLPGIPTFLDHPYNFAFHHAFLWCLNQGKEEAHGHDQLREAPSGASGEGNRRLVRNSDGGAKRMGRDSPQQESSWGASWKIYAHVKMIRSSIARGRFRRHPSTPRQYTEHHSYPNAPPAVTRMTTGFTGCPNKAKRWLVLHSFWKGGGWAVEGEMLKYLLSAFQASGMDGYTRRKVGIPLFRSSVKSTSSDLGQ